MTEDPLQFTAALIEDRPKEECGIFGVSAKNCEAARLAFFGLFALQHRGQESAGIAVSDGALVRMHKDMGLVAQVFNEEILTELPGSLGIGHTRYSTTGASVLRNAQPIFCQSQVGEIAVAHNGNLINAGIIRRQMQEQGEAFDSTNDSEVMARIFVHALHLGVENAISELMRTIQGAYSVAVLTPTMVIGFRDPNGVRPLIVGEIEGGHVLASETCALGPINAKFVRELEPGEAVILEGDQIRYLQAAQPREKSMCLFEFIYFARPDSTMYSQSLYEARERMGIALWQEHPIEADIVVPVPDSGIPAALGFSHASGIEYREGMVKSRYIHRTFIQPDQRMREMGVRMKLTPIVPHLTGKRVVLVDDSIVRGTTTKQIVKLMFDSGAEEVHVRITAPPIMHPCFYGIDMASRGELAAARMTIDEICADIGATSLGYLSVEAAKHAASPDGKGFCTACFTGSYPIPVPDSLHKLALEEIPEVGDFAAVNPGQLSLFGS